MAALGGVVLCSSLPRLRAHPVSFCHGGPWVLGKNAARLRLEGVWRNLHLRPGQVSSQRLQLERKKKKKNPRDGHLLHWGANSSIFGQAEGQLQPVDPHAHMRTGLQYPQLDTHARTHLPAMGTCNSDARSALLLCRSVSDMLEVGSVE